MNKTALGFSTMTPRPANYCPVRVLRINEPPRPPPGNALRTTTPVSVVAIDRWSSSITAAAIGDTPQSPRRSEFLAATDCLFVGVPTLTPCSRSGREGPETRGKGHHPAGIDPRIEAVRAVVSGVGVNPAGGPSPRPNPVSVRSRPKRVRAESRHGSTALTHCPECLLQRR